MNDNLVGSAFMLQVLIIQIHKIMEITMKLANSPGDLGSIPSHIIPKTLKMVLGAALLNTQHYNGKDQG